MESSYKWAYFEHDRHKNVSLTEKERPPFNLNVKGIEKDINEYE